MIILAFLKKHYEKLILGVLLLIFIGLLIFLRFLVQETLDIRSRKEAGFRVEGANYQKVAANFNAEKKLKEYSLWTQAASVKHDKGSKEALAAEKFSGDFILAAPMTICPECRKAIPVSDFKIPAANGKYMCSIGNHVLTPPMVVVVEEGDKDTDGDGIPDSYEKSYSKLGFNVQDKSDAALDFDNDFYTNLEEYLCNTDPSNPKLMPKKPNTQSISGLPGRLPYHVLLTCKNVEKKKYSFKLVYAGSSSFQFKIWERRKISSGQTKFGASTKSYKIGDRFVSKNEQIEIIGTTKVMKQLPGTKVKKETTAVKVRDIISGEEMVAELNTDVISPILKAELVWRPAKDRSYVVKTGEKIRLGNDLTGVDEYTVKAIGAEQKTVTLAGKDKKEYVIGSKMQMDSLLKKFRNEKKLKSGPRSVKKQR